MKSSLPRTLIVAACVASIAFGARRDTANTGAGPGVGTGWMSHDGDPGGSRFSPLTQITPANVGTLQAAWTFDTGTPSIQVTPLVVDGMMYVSAGSNIFALDPESGRVRWTFDAHAIVSRRGVAYWPGDATTAPRVYSGAGEKLIALDAKTGTLVGTFGDGGAVDLKTSVRGDVDGRFSLVSPPAIYKNIIITGGNNGEQAPSLGLYGDIRGWDARTGRLLWAFHTVPRPGEAGIETWAGESWKNRSGTNVWSFFTIDVERGLVFAPLGSPTSDYYGGDRHGANLYGNSIVALDATTGALKWYRQLVHHDIWDYDLPAAPTLIDVARGGRTIPAVAVMTKMSLLFIFNRETGEPIYGIEERPVPQSHVPGEASWPTQPFPIKPAPLARMALDPDKDFYALTPEHAAWCRDLWDKNGMYTKGPFTPPEVEGTMVTFPSTLGGGNWNGLAYDAGLGLVFTNVMNLGQVARMQRQPDSPGASAGAGADAAAASVGPPAYNRTTPWGGIVGRFWNPDSRIPCSAPPFGELVAVNVNTGEIAWKVPLGFVEELQARGLPQTGALNIGGPIVTASGLIFVGASTDRRFRAFDARSGRQLWEAALDASAHDVPMTYLAPNGRQYVVVAAGGGSYLGSPPGTKIVAFALPGATGSAPAMTSSAASAATAASANAAAVTAADALPPGDGRAAVVKMCSGCHGLRTVMAQRRTQPEWQRLVQSMAAVGAPGNEMDRSQAVAYLVWRFGRVNINTASEQDLIRIAELSAIEAAAIVEYRTHDGQFHSFDDLKKIPGLDPRRLEERADRLTLSNP
jgi:competence ComEA-like helix-hairpin-helix protein